MSDLTGMPYMHPGEPCSVSGQIPNTVHPDAYMAYRLGRSSPVPIFSTVRGTKFVAVSPTSAGFHHCPRPRARCCAGTFASKECGGGSTQGAGSGQRWQNVAAPRHTERAWSRVARRLSTDAYGKRRNTIRRGAILLLPSDGTDKMILRGRGTAGQPHPPAEASEHATPAKTLTHGI